MPELFEPTQIKSMELANRSMRSATWTGLGDEDGNVTAEAVEFYRTLAGGGVGLIVTGYQYVLRNGQQLPYMIGNYDDAQIEELRKLADGVHAEGGKIVPQIVHCGAAANPKVLPDGGEIWAPSPVDDKKKGALHAKEVSKEQIGTLIEAYAAAAVRAKKAGFDGVQLHGAHGYGINQFLSPFWNRRGDAYGGKLANRYRFLAEVMEAVRGAVGDDFPVMIKLNAHDFVDGGLVPEETVEIAKRLEDDGIDLIEVSGGSGASGDDLGPVRKKISKPEQEAYYADLAVRFKEAVKVPVAVVGGIRSFKTVSDILSERKADYVSFSRPFIREPDLINRWKSGDTATATCISCNGCFEAGLKGKGIDCKVERKLREKESR